LSIHDQPAYPLTAGRITQLTRSLFRFAWRPILGAAAVSLAPSLVVDAIVSEAYGNRISEWLDETRRAAQLNLPGPEQPPNFALSIAALAFAAVLSLVCGLIAYGAIVRVSDHVFRGERVGSLDAVRHTAGRFLSLFAGQLLYLVGVAIIVMIGGIAALSAIAGGGLLLFVGLIVLVGTVAAVLFFAVRASMLVQAVIVEGIGGTDGLARSSRLTAGSGWRVFGYIFLLGLTVQLLAGILVDLPEGVLGINGANVAQDAVRIALQSGVTVLIAPLQPVVLLLLYFDLRWRRGERVPRPGGGEVDGPTAEVRATGRRGA
jgi:hypothetical protein